MAQQQFPRFVHGGSFQHGLHFWAKELEFSLQGFAALHFIVEDKGANGHSPKLVVLFPFMVHR